MMGEATCSISSNLCNETGIFLRGRNWKSDHGEGNTLLVSGLSGSNWTCLEASSRPVSTS